MENLPSTRLRFDNDDGLPEFVRVWPFMSPEEEDLKFVVCRMKRRDVTLSEGMQTLVSAANRADGGNRSATVSDRRPVVIMEWKCSGEWERQGMAVHLEPEVGAGGAHTRWLMRLVS
jgi:hypothetical protein